jgi:hypothetical protein
VKVVAGLHQAIAAFAILWLAPSAVSAAPCGRPDLIETFPKDGTSGVPTNAELSARYAPSAEYVQEEVPFEHVGVGPEMATVHFNSNEGLLTLSPASPLVGAESYRIKWPALRGISTAILGKSADVTFTAGASQDSAAPTFAGVKSVDWDVERSNDDCTGGAEDRFLFDIRLSPASDDSTNDLLTLVVFQTAGPETTGGSPEPVLVQKFPESGSAQVRRSIDAAKGKVCFAALVRDSIGQISSSAEHEVCTKTVKPPFFYGCTMAGEQGPPRVLFLPALLCSLFLLRRRGRHLPRG